MNNRRKELYSRIIKRDPWYGSISFYIVMTGSALAVVITLLLWWFE